MVLVHLLPTLGGLFLSFKNLNTFTFRELFGAPWTGLDNYDAILFDADNPLHDGFVGAVQNTAVYTFWTVLGTLGGGLAVALLLNRQMRGQQARPHADADAVDRAELRRRGAVAVHVAERRRDRQQGPRRLHGHRSASARSG